MRRVPTLLLVGCLTIAAKPLNDGVTLRRAIGDAKAEVYKIEFKENRLMTSERFADSELDTEQTSTVSIQTVKPFPDEGKAEVTVGYVVDSHVTKGPGIFDGDSLGLISLKGALTARGELLLDDKALSRQEQLTQIAVSAAEAGIFVQLPEKPVVVGDTWEVAVPTPPSKNMPPQKLTAKFVGEKKVGEKDAWLVETSGTVNYATRQEFSFEAGGEQQKRVFTSTFASKVKGEILIDPATGRTLQANTKLDKHSTSALSGGTAEVTMNGTHTVSIHTTAQ